MRAQFDPCRTRLGRIRCLKSCLKSFSSGEAFPEALCYTCKDVAFVCSSSYLETHSEIATHSTAFSLPEDSNSDTSLSLTESLKDVIPVGTVACDINTKLYCSAELMTTRFGNWLKVFEVKQGSGKETKREEFNPPVWVLMHGASSEEPSSLEPETKSHDVNSTSAQDWIVEDDLKINSWLGCVESQYSMSITKKPELSPTDTDTVSELLHIPKSWSTECDEQLVAFLSDTIEIGNSNLGSIQSFVDQISVSSSCGQDDEEKLTDGNSETFWESDGAHGQHYIRLKMKKNTIISRLYVTINMDDENYLPERIVVAGGDLDNMDELNETNLDLSSDSSVRDECVFQDAIKHYPYIEIRIRSCKDEGIDTRIRGLKISSTREADVGLSVDAFTQKDKLCRYPALEGYSKKLLYRRAQALQRLVFLMDSVLNYLVPAWNDNTGTLNLLENVKHLLPLSTKRAALLDTLLKNSENKASVISSSNFPKVIINRRSAAEHRANPNLDKHGSNTVFNQLYEGLKPRNPNNSPLDYRWPGFHTQWWECKFVGEGIIDQGGGFRDSLCDIAEELCPPSPDDLLPLHLFTRAPNQMNADSNTNRDVYVPNSSCTKFSQYIWIGQLMGACFRGKENLVLSLPCFIWKKISNETVNWASDYTSVDAAEVKLLGTLDSLDEEDFNIHFGERTWTVILSNGMTHEVVENGANKPLQYEDRIEYGRLAKEARMSEFDRQVNAIKEGFMSVIPETVLNLLAWKEIEIRVCGNPEISIEGLKKSVHLDDLEATDERVKIFWEVMTNFSNEDRSRFLRFVTGRKRLPCPLYIGPRSVLDCLPESSTCSNTLYLPRYSNAKIAEEKLRYAAYNCVAIDTDLNPWD